MVERRKTTLQRSGEMCKVERGEGQLVARETYEEGKRQGQKRRLTIEEWHELLLISGRSRAEAF